MCKQKNNRKIKRKKGKKEKKKKRKQQVYPRSGLGNLALCRGTPSMLNQIIDNIAFVFTYSEPKEQTEMNPYGLLRSFLSIYLALNTCIPF